MTHKLLNLDMEKYIFIFFFVLFISCKCSISSKIYNFITFTNDPLMEDIGGIGNKYFFRGLQKIDWWASKAHCETRGFKLAQLSQVLDIDFIYENAPPGIDLWTDAQLVPSMKNFKSLGSGNPVNQTLAFTYDPLALSSLAFSTIPNRAKRMVQTTLTTSGWHFPLCVFELPMRSKLVSTGAVDETQIYNFDQGDKYNKLQKNHYLNNESEYSLIPRINFIGEYNDKLYFYGENKTSWTDASNYCSEFSMNLTEILTDDEAGFIYANGPDLLLWTDFYLNPSYSDFIWLSLNQSVEGYPHPIMSNTLTSSFTALTLDGRIGPTAARLIQTLRYDLHNPLCHLSL